MCSLEDIPDLAKLNIFKYLSVDDLKNVRLVSNRMSRDVLKLDRRLKIFTVRLHDTPPDDDLLASNKFEVRLVVDSEFLQTNVSRKIDWARTHSDMITHMDIKISSDDKSMLVDLLAGDELKFCQLRTVELEVQDDEALIKILSKFNQLVKKLCLKYIDLNKIKIENKLNLSSLTEMNCIHINSFEAISTFLMSAKQSLEELKITSGNFSPDYNRLPQKGLLFNKLKKIQIHAEDTEQMSCELLASCALTLTSLSLRNITLPDCRSMKGKFTKLKHLKLMAEQMRLSDLLLLIHGSSSVIQSIHISVAKMLPDADLDFELPALRFLSVENCGDLTWLLKFLENSPALSTIVLNTVDVTCFDLMEFTLPSMRTVSLRNLDQMDDSRTSSLNNLLLKCSNLESLFLNGVELAFSVNFSKLRGLLAIGAHGKYLREITMTCKSSLEILMLHECDTSILLDIERNLPKLNTLSVYPWPRKVEHVQSMKLLAQSSNTKLLKINVMLKFWNMWDNVMENDEWQSFEHFLIPHS